MLNEKTYIMLKPDAVKRRLIGEVISRIEKKGYQIAQAKLITLDKKVIAEHYDHLLDKPFYPDLESFMISGPVFGMVVEGENVIAGMRQLMGPTNIYEALPGTIRGDYANNMTENIIHGSDSEETATIEIKRFFG
jgi:nucleoside-diphosphate kinase